VSALLDYQARWYHDPAKLLVGEKARQIGLTWTTAARKVMRAARARSAGGVSCFYVSTSHLLGREFIDDCTDWLGFLGAAATHVGSTMLRDGPKDILTHEIRFASGNVIRAITSNPAAFRGLTGAVTIDEAAFHPRLGDLLKAAFAVRTWGGELAVVSTHNGRENPFAHLVDEVRTGKRKGSVHRVTIHEAVRGGVFRRMCERAGVAWTPEGEADFVAECLASWGAAEEYLVIPASGDAVYLRRSLLEAAARHFAVIRLALPEEHLFLPEADRLADRRGWFDAQVRPEIDAIQRGRVVAIGADVARSGDLSTFTVLAEDHALTKRAVVSIELRGVPFAEQWEILRLLGEALQRPGAALKWAGLAIDGTGLGAHLAEQALVAWGEASVEIVKITGAWYDAAMPRLREALEERFLEIPADADVRDDLLQLVMTPAGVRLGDHRRKDSRDGKPRHGDAAIALALALQRLHGGPAPEVDFRPVRRATEEDRDRARRRRARSP